MRTALVIAVLLLAAGGWNAFSNRSVSSRRGQEVYVSEGCIHCHSQFARPESLDTEMYGPATLPDSKPGEAVLIGNRRQGPDLSAIGLRRSRDWNRAHLIDPQLVSPGTRMPSYRHLFEGEGEGGEALLDYLAGLGVDGAAEWYRQTASWSCEVASGDREEGEALFAQLCQQCHGPEGRGDGALAERFSQRPTNFAAGGFRFAPEALEAEPRRELLARIVKYGISGTSMPGHEYLTDGDIADLVAFVSGFSVRSEAEK